MKQEAILVYSILISILISIMLIGIIPSNASGYQDSIRGYQKTIDAWDIYSGDSFCMMATTFEPQSGAAKEEMRANVIMMALTLPKTADSATFTIGGDGWHFTEGNKYELTFRFDGIERDFFIDSIAASNDRLTVNFDFRELNKEWYDKFKESKIAQIVVNEVYIGAYQMEARTAAMVLEDCLKGE